MAHTFVISWPKCVLVSLFCFSASAQRLSPALDCRELLGRAANPRVLTLLDSIVASPKVFRPEVPESRAAQDRQMALRGKFFPASFHVSEDGAAVTISPLDSSKFFHWGGEDFVEATNPSAFSVKTATGEEQEYLLPRAVVPYKNTLRPEEGSLNAPEGYYSHIPILKRSGKEWVFEDFLIKSRPDKHFFFEDPRISGPIFDSSGKPQYFLGGTDYSRHVAGEDGLFVRNVIYPLEFKNGKLQPLHVDPATGKPTNGIYISPKPNKMAEGWRAVDAKNGLVTQLDDGSIVVNTRFRVEPSEDPTYLALKEKYGDKVPTWKYSNQAFHFKNYEEFLAYDWNNAMGDLLGQELKLKAHAEAGRIVPEAKILLKDKELRDFIPKELRVEGKPLGLGNGARRVRVERKGQSIYASFNKQSEQFYVGAVPAHLQAEGRFALKDGEVSYLGADHQLGYFKDQASPTAENRGTKRVYSGMMSLYDGSLMNVKSIYANVIQPIKPHQIAGTGGILDLNHAAYFMGANIVVDPKNPQRHILRFYGGEADAHSVSYDFDAIKLLTEMSPNSTRWKSGQVYKPE